MVVGGRGVVVLLQWLWGMAVLGATGGASSSPTKNERDSAVWKGWWSDNFSGSRPNFFGRQHLTFNTGGKCDGAKQGIVRFWEVMRGEGLCDNNIKRSQLVAVTAYLIY